jgi:hypothetical protein
MLFHVTLQTAKQVKRRVFKTIICIHISISKWGEQNLQLSAILSISIVGLMPYIIYTIIEIWIQRIVPAFSRSGYKVTIIQTFGPSIWPYT